MLNALRVLTPMAEIGGTAKLWRLNFRCFAKDLRRNREMSGLQRTRQARFSRDPREQRLHKEVPENKPITSAVRDAAKDRDWARVRAAFDSAQTKSPILYSATIHAALLCNELDEGLALYEEMQADKCSVTTVTYQSVIRMLAKKGRQDEVDRIWAKMCANGVHPESRTFAYLAMMVAKAEVGDVSSAQDLLIELGAKDASQVVGEHFGALLNACAKIQDAPNAVRALAALRKRPHLVCDVIKYTSCMNALLGSPIADVYKVYNQMVQDNIRPDRFFVEPYIQALLGMSLQSDLTHVDPDRIKAVRAALREADQQGWELPKRVEKWRKTVDA